MLLKRTLILRVLISCFALLMCWAGPVATAKFTVKLLTQQPVDQKIELQIFQDPISINAGYEVKWIDPASANRYTFSVPVSKAGNTYINVYCPGFGTLINVQPVEAGDDVVITVKPTNEDPELTFSGTGSGKYTFNRAVNFLGEIDELAQFYTNPKRMKKYSDSLTVVVLDRLRNTKDISRAMREEMTVNLQGWTALGLVARLIYGDLKNDRFRSEAFGVIEQLEQAQLSTPAALKSVAYCEYLYKRSKLKLALQRGTNLDSTDKGFKFVDLYNEIRNNYTGLMREKLLTFCLIEPKELAIFFQGSDADEFLSALNDGLKLVTRDDYRAAIQHKKDIAGKGSKVPDFEFVDVQGKTVRLSDFKGKAVFVDVWSNPCGGCLVFKRTFEENIYPSIKDNKNIVVLSVGLSEKKEDWLASIPQFSNKEFVNVYTSGQGTGHPFAEYYEVRILPTLLLFGPDGNLVSGTVPRGYRPAELLELIQKSAAQ